MLSCGIAFCNSTVFWCVCCGVCVVVVVYVVVRLRRCFCITVVPYWYIDNGNNALVHCESQ